MEKLVDRPKRRRWFKPRQPAWVVLEPNRLGMAGGAVAAFCALVFYFLRDMLGYPMAPDRVIVGAAMTFVVGYGAVGAFFWYLLWVAERELPISDDETYIGIRRDPNAAAAEAPTVPEPPAESNEDV